ncbi:hypothetical protein OP862_00515 [Yersinia massiliensis]|jgi:hypothetical protein|uniref:Uncharacterized protein n=2 Tax=Yersinia TaxID=629 RepID=A0AAI8ZUI9_YERFR|nr:MULTISPECIES: hypothetical protein [Yersinia]HEI6966151.1 hypothetical protein [Yersinia enterocolitica]ATM87922.1 hypothetical protein CRN74_18675 [Yersinia frederiksenii]MCB5318787.1 hypothetical protein [Yersinia massiliensis]MDA5547943.1 hypothetical protein [Yersinia massiliensis]MDN0128166.1 hypothetical protein [Yersinia massiliensis]
MDLLSVTKSNADINITENELLILNSALNEVCNGIDIAEFETRIGSERDEVAALLSKIGSILDQMSSC